MTATREVLERAKTVGECIHIYEETMDEIWGHQKISCGPPGGFKPYWNTAIKALEKALELVEAESTFKEAKMIAYHNIFDIASRYKDRANFVKLAKRAKKKYDEIFESL